jgi:hypothetical protein
MSANQQLGLDFEDWVRETFTSNQKGSCTEKWDIADPNYKRKYSKHTSPFSGLPVSIKTCKAYTSVCFGDALRQYSINQNFLLIVGFYSRAGNSIKFEDVSAGIVSWRVWRNLFAEAVSEDELKKDRMTAKEMGEKIKQLDELIKDRDLHYKTVRKKAKAEKALLPQMEISLNQKIDSKNQRRLQCSLRYDIFRLKFYSPGEIHADGKPRLWGEEIPKF